MLGTNVYTFYSPVPMPCIHMIQTCFLLQSFTFLHPSWGRLTQCRWISGTLHKSLVLPGNLRITSATLYLFNISTHWQLYCLWKVSSWPLYFSFSKNGLSPSKIWLTWKKYSVVIEKHNIDLPKIINFFYYTVPHISFNIIPILYSKNVLSNCSLLGEK